MSTNFCIAGVQMATAYGHDNVPAMRARLDVLMTRFPWVELVLFSELSPFGASLEHAQHVPGPAEHAFCEMAARHKVWLIPGSVFERRGEKIYNTASVIDPTGRVVGRYSKMFPFKPYEAGVEGGTEFLVWDIPDVGRFGLSICYDMWFPETTRTLAALGAEVILHPTLTNTIDRDVELAIARASAAQNQCFVVDINGVGDGGYGRSIVVRPTGTVMYEAGAGEELIPFDVNMDLVRNVRRNGMFRLGQHLKSFRDRMVSFDVYQPHGPGTEYLASLGPLETPKRREAPTHPWVPPPAGAPTAPSAAPATALPLTQLRTDEPSS